MSLDMAQTRKPSTWVGPIYRRPEGSPAHYVSKNDRRTYVRKCCTSQLQTNVFCAIMGGLGRKVMKKIWLEAESFKSIIPLTRPAAFYEVDRKKTYWHRKANGVILGPRVVK